jgi:hypothetical protein
MLVLFMSRAIPSAAQAHGSANAHPSTFATAAPANTGFQYLPLTEPDNLPPVLVTPVLVTPLTSYSDYWPLFGREAGVRLKKLCNPTPACRGGLKTAFSRSPKSAEGK